MHGALGTKHAARTLGHRVRQARICARVPLPRASKVRRRARDTILPYRRHATYASGSAESMCRAHARPRCSVRGARGARGCDGGGHARSTRGRAWPRSGTVWEAPLGLARSLGYPDEPSSSRPCDSPHLLRAQSTPSVLKRTVAATVITRRTGGQVITINNKYGGARAASSTLTSAVSDWQASSSRVSRARVLAPGYLRSGGRVRDDARRCVCTLGSPAA